VILADEPTAHLDYIQVDGILQLIGDLSADGRLVVVATHDERMIPLADAVVNLTPRPDTTPREPEVLELAAGELVFEQGSRGDLVYVVEDGEVEIFRQRDDGTEESVAMVDPGAYFGELAPMFGLRRSASARAAVPTKLTAYGLRDFREKFNLTNEAKILSNAGD
jgi:putative ABC transport system ATP-binding protein